MHKNNPTYSFVFDGFNLWKQVLFKYIETDKSRPSFSMTLYRKMIRGPFNIKQIFNFPLYCYQNQIMIIILTADSSSFASPVKTDVLWVVRGDLCTASPRTPVLPRDKTTTCPSTNSVLTPLWNICVKKPTSTNRPVPRRSTIH